MSKEITRPQTSVKVPEVQDEQFTDHIEVALDPVGAWNLITALRAQIAALVASQPAPDCQQPDLVTADAQPVTVKIKPLDVSHILRHAFLAGFVAAREIPAGDECDGRELWLDFDPTVNPAYQRVMTALEAAPHVNETPKSEHDSADMLPTLPTPATLAEAARIVREAINKGHKPFRLATNAAFREINCDGLVVSVGRVAIALEAALRAIEEGEA